MDLLYGEATYRAVACPVRRACLVAGEGEGLELDGAEVALALAGTPVRPGHVHVVLVQGDVRVVVERLASGGRRYRRRSRADLQRTRLHQCRNG